MFRRIYYNILYIEKLDLADLSKKVRTVTFIRSYFTTVYISYLDNPSQKKCLTIRFSLFINYNKL